ncbi:phosphoadenosine phosphosulfate reductase [PinkBerry-associated phage LS06-2018-MD08]|nr:phosphoadenosine phosphosulfate reductase [PinkBerry-associated phage LS06-2018-MD08]
MKYLVFYSGGIGSFYATKLLVNKYGKENVVALFTDTNFEDESLYKFINQTVKHLGIDIIYLKAPYDPLELMVKENVLYNNRMANCTHYLKMRLAKAFINNRDYILLRERFNIESLIAKGKKYYPFDKTNWTFVLGIDWTEAHRIEAPKRNWKPNEVIAPLIDDLTYDRSIALKYMRDNNIYIPMLYSLGFSHNNCGARCVKAGQGHWINVLKTLPNRFKEMKDFENMMREKIGDYSYLKITRKTIKSSYTLEQLEKDYLERPEQLDLFDIGGCGCFLE